MAQKVSIIIEWENTLLAEMNRPMEMLRRLGTQVEKVHAERNTDFELLVAFNDEDIEESIPRQIVLDTIDPKSWAGTIKFQCATGRHYYELKNFAADKAEGNVIIFLDSDVVPDDGWLSSMLSSLDDPEIQFVAGNTYMSTEDFIGKCFAVFWIFKPRQPFSDKHIRSSFYANNIAFRKAFFLQNKFPVEACYRGQCGALASSLKGNGFQIVHHGRAWVSHPAPNGFSHFVARAAAKGHDNVYWNRKKHGSWAASPIGAVARFVANLGTVLFRMISRPAKIGVGPISALGGAIVGAAYHSIVFSSEIVSFFNPRFIRRNIHI